MRLIDADELYEKTAEWEASALAKIEELNRTPLEEMDDAQKNLWRKWMAILNERSAFKHDVSDAPTIEPQQWIPVSSGLLPKAEHGEGEDVLCQLENMRRIVLYFDGGNWCYPSGEPYIGVNYENGWSNKVVAWMPLPNLWEGDEA